MEKTLFYDKRARTSIGKSKQQPGDPAQVQEQGSSSTCVSHDKRHVDLLYLASEERSHYVWIKNLNRLIKGQYKDGYTGKGMHLCHWCLYYCFKVASQDLLLMKKTDDRKQRTKTLVRWAVSGQLDRSIVTCIIQVSYSTHVRCAFSRSFEYDGTEMR